MIIDTLYFSGASSIELEDKVILTGGVIDSEESSTVSIYGRDGWLRDLQNLQSIRRSHGCGHYVDDSNRVVSSLFRRSLNIFIN